jgi:hypothetical protein
MTAAEVEAILGPARDESTGPTTFHTTVLNHVNAALPPREWVADRVVVRVSFGDDGRVSTVEVLGNTRFSRGPFEVVRGWLGL